MTSAVDLRHQIVDGGAALLAQSVADTLVAPAPVRDKRIDDGGDRGPSTAHVPAPSWRDGGRRSRTAIRLATYWSRSPSGGRITTVEPSMTWSPLSKVARSAISQHRWSEACPGVWTAHDVQRGGARTESERPPVADAQIRGEPLGGSETDDPGAGGCSQSGRPGGMVAMGMGHQHRAQPPERCRRSDDGVAVHGIVGSGIHHHEVICASPRPDQIGIGPRTGHQSGIGCGQAVQAGLESIETTGDRGGPDPKEGTAASVGSERPAEVTSGDPLGWRPARSPVPPR